MIDYSNFFKHLKQCGLGEVASELESRTQNALENISHGDFDKWLNTVEQLPVIKPSMLNLAVDRVQIGTADDCDEPTRENIKDLLMQLHPWRKGPFEVFGIHIDTEWRSDLKWQRVQKAIKPLKDKLILDVGSGNGYYCLRMLGEGAKAAVGVDPFLLYLVQFQAIKKYLNTSCADVLPLGVEDLPADMHCFDTVFSMGILYHRRDPVEHLKSLGGYLKKGGQLVLETIILEDETKTQLIPEKRYAKMRNVWSVPSIAMLKDWLGGAGFENITVADVTKTTFKEQRKTEWMKFESLSDFLDPEDPAKTIEGHPAPVRAVVVADIC